MGDVVRVDPDVLAGVAVAVQESATRLAAAPVPAADAGALTGGAAAAALVRAADGWGGFVAALAERVAAFGTDLDTAARDYRRADTEARHALGGPGR